jgi:AcrR family transcriptional regulator
VDRRTQLLEIALELINERGVRGASMRELARRAGVDVRSTYYHFESKRDLLRSLFEQAGMLALLVEPVPPDVLDALASLTPAEALLLVIEGNLQSLHEGAPYSRLIHSEVLVNDEDAKTVGAEMWTRWGEQLEVLVGATRVCEADRVASFARLLRSLLWGVFNESQLTGEIADQTKRHARALELTDALTGQHQPGRKR